MSNTKCRAKGGPVACKDPACPERQAFLNDFSSVKPVFFKKHFKVAPTPRPGAWTNKDSVLYRTVHGSRLYGLNHDNSDEDFI